MKEREKEIALREFGLQIATAREKKGISQTELSRMLGKFRTYMNNVEAGRLNLSYFSILEICECLQISLNELINS